jgi:hypothetical protein
MIFYLLSSGLDLIPSLIKLLFCYLIFLCFLKKDLSSKYSPYLTLKSFFLKTQKIPLDYQI